MRFRNAVQKAGILSGLTKNIIHPANPSLFRTVTWTLSNLCRGKPQVSTSHLPQLTPLVRQCLQSEDIEVLVDACWAASYLSDGENERIKICQNEVGLTERLIHLMEAESSTLSTPALRAVGNFCTGEEAETQLVIDSGVLRGILRLLDEDNQKTRTRKEAAWLLSNIAAGNPAQVEALFTAFESRSRGDLVKQVSERTSGNG